MEPDPLRQFLERIDTDQPQFLRQELAEELGSDWSVFRSAGFIRFGSPARFALCPGCRQSSGRAVFLANRSTGQTCTQINCPDCGHQAVPAEALERWIVDVSAFLAAVGRAAGTAAPPTEVIPGRLWRLGIVPMTGITSLTAYFGRSPREADLAQVAQVMQKHPAAVLMFAGPHGLTSWKQPFPRVRLALSEVLSFGPSGLVFDVRGYASLARREGSGKPAKRKPKLKRASRAATIEALVKEITAHLRRAADHAFHTKEQSGGPSLLRRPTQKLLGELAGGIPPYTVSKCLKDPEANQLRILWKLANDRYGLMKWGRRKR